MFPGGDPRPFHKLTKEEQATIEKKRLAGNYINQSLIENYICLQILSPKKGGILFYLCPSVQDIFRRNFLSNC